MMDTIVRLVSLELSNIKNVKNGRIVMPGGMSKDPVRDKAEILGIYGQNGSGKTAVIDTLYYLQKIMNGESLAEEFEEYIDATSSQAEIVTEFNVFNNDIFYEVGYKIVLGKAEKEIEIQRETLSFAKTEDGVRSNKTVFMDFQREKENPVFLPKKRYEEVIETNKENSTDLIVARKMAEKSRCSYVFGESSREIFFQNYTNRFKECAELIHALFMFSLKDLFVIRNTHSGVISANVLLPVAFKIEQGKVGLKGDFAIPMTKPVVLEAERKQLLDTLVEQINTVLYTIIPGMSIAVQDDGKQLTDSGVEGYKVELVSIRDNTPPIPIRMESEGIIKIISILNALIQAFANPSICLAIDEMDAGIFEYMLGELLDIFNKNAKGQLVFTSHNLRALEMLDKESIMFSTANPNKRYIHMKNIKPSNNLRDVYLRGITLGGQDEVIYEATDSLKIARAFRKAGRSIRNG
ncbi:MAG: ATP-binding protein [Lachnospiraceae bacterium]|nr:ATP-binding protein [Lachnospiraceae bacterium]